MKSSNSYSYTRIPSPPIEDLSTPPNRPVDTSTSIGSSLPVDLGVVARIHFKEFNDFLVSYVPNAEKADSRQSARMKLTRLTRLQFQELCTDVYDELIRQKTNANDTEVPFLPAQAIFHPKRNQARQKLSTLPTYRYQDLCSDIHYELVRRYPECKEGLSLTTGLSYDNFPSTNNPSAPGNRAGDWTTPNRFGSISKNPPSGEAPTRMNTTLL